MSGRRWAGWRLAVLAGLLVLATAPGVAGGHDPVGGGEGGLSVPFVAVVAVTVVGSVLAGAGVVTVVGERGTARLANRLGRVVGVALVVLGLSYAVAAVGHGPVLGMAGVTVGGLVTHYLVGRSAHAPARTAFGAVAAHRTVEGLALAAVYAAGSALGLVAVVLVVGHAALETCAVGALAVSAGRLRALLAVGAVHVGFLAGAVVGVTAVAVLPPGLDAAVLALGGGALLAVGADELAAPRGHGVDRSDPVSAPGSRR